MINRASPARRKPKNLKTSTHLNLSIRRRVVMHVVMTRKEDDIMSYLFHYGLCESSHFNKATRKHQVMGSRAIFSIFHAAFRSRRPVAGGDGVETF